MLLKVMTQYFHTQLCSMHLGSEEMVDFQTWIRNIIKLLCSNIKILLLLEIYCLKSSYIKHLSTVLMMYKKIFITQFEMVFRYLYTSVITTKSENNSKPAVPLE